jgi:hypothetical protein
LLVLVEGGADGPEADAERADVARLLIRAGARADADAGGAALVAAAARGDEATLRALLAARGAAPLRPALEAAAAAGGGSAARVGAVKALLEAGAGRRGGARAALERARDARDASLIALLSQPRWRCRVLSLGTGIGAGRAAGERR